MITKQQFDELRKNAKWGADHDFKEELPAEKILWDRITSDYLKENNLTIEEYAAKETNNDIESAKFVILMTLWNEALEKYK